MMDIILWVIFGALVGWIASIIMGTNKEQGGLANIIVGVVGAFIGGSIARTFGEPGITGFNLTSFLIALLGAMVLLGVVNLFARE
ncbi:MAG TPA: GlsB/YeaQ/YmgE family stress response membrane protein [Candidatus Saccharimonadales bacterium]|nr:GlsB/YeaQ/YmgE family stress response membrane protein [Candidatus Saccharimonadales bacterium]